MEEGARVYPARIAASSLQGVWYLAQGYFNSALKDSWYSPATSTPSKF